MAAALTTQNQDIDIAGPFRRAISRLFSFGRDLLERLAGARTLCVTTYIPRHMARDIPAAEARISRALYWLAALSLTIAGRDDQFLPPPGAPTPTPRHPSDTARIRDRTPSPNPSFAPDDRDNPALLARIRRTFATVPTCVIARGIARRLGIRQDSESWPRDLLAITDTPADFYARAERAWRAPTIDPDDTHPDTTPDLPNPPTDPPPFHPRE